MGLIRRWHWILLAAIVVLWWLGRSTEPESVSVALPQTSLPAVAAAPSQALLRPPAEFPFGQYTLHLLAEFALDARVLAQFTHPRRHRQWCLRDYSGDGGALIICLRGALRCSALMLIRLPLNISAAPASTYQSISS